MLVECYSPELVQPLGLRGLAGPASSFCQNGLRWRFQVQIQTCNRIPGRDRTSQYPDLTTQINMMHDPNGPTKRKHITVFHVFLPLRLLFHERKKRCLRGTQNSNQIFSMAIAQNTLCKGDLATLGWVGIRGCYRFCHVKPCSHVLKARLAQGLLHKHLALMFSSP